MTWKDAMIYIASIKWYMEERVEATKEYYDALDIALASMCSVSRDTVDKAWRGEWVEEVIKKRDLKGNEHDYYSPWNCSKCHSPDPKNGESIFCSACAAGRPRGGEAADGCGSSGAVPVLRKSS